MRRKKIVKILSLMMVSSILMNGIQTFKPLGGLLSNTSIAYATTNIQGLKRTGGVITGKVTLSNPIPDETKNPTVEQLAKIAKKIDPVTNPTLFSKPIDSYVIQPVFNYLTDDLLYYSDDHTYAIDGSTVHFDYFVKILKMEKGSKVNEVKTTYAHAYYKDGVLIGIDSNATVEFTDAEAYNYLVNESKTPEVPSQPETKPEVPSEPEKPKPETPQIVTRLGGLTRYQTSTVIASKYTNGQKVNNVILSTGTDFADSLSASALSGKLNAPIVLARTNAENSSDAINFIVNNVNKNGTVYVVGGSGVVSDSIVNAIKAKGFNNIKRLGGSTRFDTNVLINNELNVAKGTPVIIANSHSFPDALSISSVSGINKYPIFLTPVGSINDKVLASIKKIAPSKIYIVGETGVVNRSVENTLRGITSNITRLGGATRFETSMIVAKHFNLQSDSVVIANGYNFPDALSGAPLAIKHNAQILLVPNNNTLVQAQSDFVKSKKFKNIYTLGDTGVVSDNVVNTIK